MLPAYTASDVTPWYEATLAAAEKLTTMRLVNTVNNMMVSRISTMCSQLQLVGFQAVSVAFFRIFHDHVDGRAVLAKRFFEAILNCLLGQLVFCHVTDHKTGKGEVYSGFPPLGGASLPVPATVRAATARLTLML
jgi:hypothetical protein